MGTAAVICLILTIIFGLMTVRFASGGSHPSRALEPFGVFIYGPMTFVCGFLTVLFWFLK